METGVAPDTSHTKQQVYQSSLQNAWKVTRPRPHNARVVHLLRCESWESSL